MEKTILAARRLTKKKTENKNPEGLTVSQLRLHVRGDRGRETQEESLFSGQVRKASATPTPETGYDAAYGPPLPLLLLLPLATSRENGASAQGNWIEFPVGRSNSALWPVAFFKVWRKNKKATTTTTTKQKKRNQLKICGTGEIRRNHKERTKAGSA